MKISLPESGNIQIIDPKVILLHIYSVYQAPLHEASFAFLGCLHSTAGWPIFQITSFIMDSENVYSHFINVQLLAVLHIDNLHVSLTINNESK